MKFCLFNLYWFDTMNLFFSLNIVFCNGNGFPWRKILCTGTRMGWKSPPVSVRWDGDRNGDKNYPQREIPHWHPYLWSRLTSRLPFGGESKYGSLYQPHNADWTKDSEPSHTDTGITWTRTGYVFSLYSCTSSSMNTHILISIHPTRWLRILPLFI
jgi:hypothetical protein